MSCRSSRPRKSTPTTERKILADGTIVFSAFPKRVEDVPLEYQAAVYAKNRREQDAKQAIKARAQLDGLRADLKALKIKLRATPVGTARSELEKEIKAKERAIRKAPKPKRKWSPVLSGSFETGKR